ncbi:MAG: hypothetical protein M3Y91_04865 [Actinomycetota bacterium]|nr:hypothetical protein [Actinomycetota bacterium]
MVTLDHADHADRAARAARHITSPQPQVSRTPTARHNPLQPNRTYDYDHHGPHHGPEHDGPDLGM